MYPALWCPLHAQDHRLASGHFQRYTLHVEFQRRLILSNQGRLRLSFWISFSSVSVLLQLASEVTIRAVFSKWMLWMVICTWQKPCIWDNNLLQLMSSCCSASRAVPVPMSGLVLQVPLSFSFLSLLTGILWMLLAQSFRFFSMEKFPKQCGNTWGSYGSSKRPGWLDRGGGRVAHRFHRYFRGFVLACSFRLWIFVVFGWRRPTPAAFVCKFS